MTDTDRRWRRGRERARDGSARNGQGIVAAARGSRRVVLEAGRRERREREPRSNDERGPWRRGPSATGTTRGARRGGTRGGDGRRGGGRRRNRARARADHRVAHRRRQPAAAHGGKLTETQLYTHSCTGPTATTTMTTTTTTTGGGITRMPVCRYAARPVTPSGRLSSVEPSGTRRPCSTSARGCRRFTRTTAGGVARVWR